jgi:hypothetical protein
MFTFQPNVDPWDPYSYRFVCIGPNASDPCLTSVEGTSAYAVTGAFEDADTLAVYPIEIRQDGGTFAIAPPGIGSHGAASGDGEAHRRRQRGHRSADGGGRYRAAVPRSASDFGDGLGSVLSFRSA